MAKEKKIHGCYHIHLDFYTDVVKKRNLRLYKCKGMYGNQNRQDMQSGRISRKSLTADSKRQA